MANTTIPIPTLYGGVSRQAPAVRHAGQVEEAENVLLSVEKGASKRPGSEMQFAVASLAADGAYRIHTIDRDDVEKYLLLYGASTIRVFDLDGNELYVLISTAAQAYLDAESATAADLRCVTVADYTILLNRLVATGYLTSDPFTITTEHKDYTTMIAQTPAHDTYHRAKDDDGFYDSARIAGYWKYEPGPGTFAKIVFDPVTGDPGTAEKYEVDGNNPGGFKVSFIRLAMALAAAAWDEVGYTLTEAAAFANYTWRQGDQIYLDAGTGVAVGWYVINSKVDDNVIVLATSCAAAANADTTSTNIGIHCVATTQFAQEDFGDMHEVASAFQSELRKTLGAEDALIGWTDTGLITGYMTITSPFRGENATALATESPDAGFDYTAAGLAFSNAGGEYTITAGTGTPGGDTLSPFDRWTRQPAPNQPKALLDPAKMPVQIVRRPVSEDDYADLVKDHTPFAYWRLGEAAGATAADEMGANDGTYIAAPTLGATGAISGDSDTAVTFDGAAEYINVGTLGNFGTQIAVNGLTVEMWVKRQLDGASMYLIDAIDEGEANPTGFDFWIAGIGATMYLSLHVNGDPLSEVTFRTDGNLSTAFPAGVWRHVCATWVAGEDEMHFYLNGEEIASTLYAPGSVGLPPTAIPNFLDDVVIAARIREPAAASQFFKGTLDEVAIYSRVLTPEQIRQHYELGTATFDAFFDVDTIAWTPRQTGDQFTNPLPSIVEAEKTLSDIGFHANRTVLAGDENLVYSQASDFFNFFIENHDDIGDADPIDTALSSARITIVDHVVAFDRALVIFTKAGQQFETNAPTLFTFATVVVTPSTAYKTIEGVRPVPMENFLYFPARLKGTTQLLEYYYSEQEAAHTAADVSKHCAGYLPSDIQTIEVGLNNNVVFLLPADAYTIYAYRYYWDAEKKVQSAWAKYSFGLGERIVDIGVIGNDIWMLVENADGFFISSLSIPPDVSAVAPDTSTLEDFTTYTEIDTAARAIVTAPKVAVTDLDHNENLNVYVDKTSILFFKHEFELKIGAASGDGLCGAWTLSNTHDTMYTMWEERHQAIGVVAKWSAADGGEIIFRNYRTSVTDSWTGAERNTSYYFTIERTDYTTVVCSIYSDSARTVPVATLTVPIPADRSYRYLQAAVGEDSNPPLRNEAFDIDIENLAVFALATPYVVHLDNRIDLTGVHAAGTTTWTLPVADTSIECAVLGPEFGPDAGTIVELTQVTSTSYTAAGDYSAGDAALGRQYIMNLELSRPYMRGRNGAAILDMSLQLLKLVTNHLNTGQYTIRVAQSGRANRDYEFTPRDGSLLDEEGNSQAFLQGRADDTQVSIRDDSPFPVTISSAEYVATFVRRSR